MEHMSRWHELMSRPEHQIPLDEAALLIAAQADPGLDVAAQLARLDEAAAQLGSADTEQVCGLVFEELGVRGDSATYDDPRNSYLDQVLDRRLGIPISLSVLLMEIGRRCGVTLVGVGMPGHFLVRDPDRPDLLIDAFSGGRRLDRAACAELLQSVAATELHLPDGLLASVGSRAILTRMLANLDQSFRRRADTQGVRWAARLRAAIPGQPLADQISLADGLAGLGLYEDAAALLEASARSPGVAEESARALRGRARGLLARFN
jgi:regulator of sirC expression with transglutaminase-like and TPR domain